MPNKIARRMKYDLTAEFEISLAKETQRDITSKGNTERNHVPRKTRHTSLARLVS